VDKGEKRDQKKPNQEGGESHSRHRLNKKPRVQPHGLPGRVGRVKKNQKEKKGEGPRMAGAPDHTERQGAFSEGGRPTTEKKRNRDGGKNKNSKLLHTSNWAVKGGKERSRGGRLMTMRQQNKKQKIKIMAIKPGKKGGAWGGGEKFKGKGHQWG